jgi:hypothetical protein
MSHTPEPPDSELEIRDLDPTPVHERPWIVRPGRVALLGLTFARTTARWLLNRAPSGDVERNGRSTRP